MYSAKQIFDWPEKLKSTDVWSRHWCHPQCLSQSSVSFHGSVCSELKNAMTIIIIYKYQVEECWSLDSCTKLTEMNNGKQTSRGLLILYSRLLPSRKRWSFTLWSFTYPIYMSEFGGLWKREETQHALYWQKDKWLYFSTVIWNSRVVSDDLHTK